MLSLTIDDKGQFFSINQPRSFGIGHHYKEVLMEALLEAVSSPTRLWWSKMGKWQALMVVATLATFFVTLGITGNTKDAVVVAFAATFAFAVFAVFAAFASVATAVTAVTGVVATSLVVIVALAAVVVIVATFVVVFAGVVAFLVVDEVPGVSKKAIRFSYAAEFLVIILPMLGTILYG